MRTPNNCYFTCGGSCWWPSVKVKIQKPVLRLMDATMWKEHLGAAGRDLKRLLAWVEIQPSIGSTLSAQPLQPLSSQSHFLTTYRQLPSSNSFATFTTLNSSTAVLFCLTWLARSLWCSLEILSEVASHPSKSCLPTQARGGSSHPSKGPNQPASQRSLLPAACRCLTLTQPHHHTSLSRARPAISHNISISSYLQALVVLAPGQLLAGAVLGDLAPVSLLLEAAPPSPFTGGLGLRPHHGVTQVQSAASTLTHCRRPAPGDCLRSSPPRSLPHSAPLKAAAVTTQTGCRAQAAKPARALLCFAACRVLFSLLANSRAAGPLL